VGRGVGRGGVQRRHLAPEGPRCRDEAEDEHEPPALAGVGQGGVGREAVVQAEAARRELVAAHGQRSLLAQQWQRARVDGVAEGGLARARVRLEQRLVDEPRQHPHLHARHGGEMVPRRYEVMTR
jgi:hypothetical protein